MTDLKDDQLDSLARIGNVAQFASFGPGPSPQLRHLWLSSNAPRPDGLEAAVRQVLSASSGRVNVRTFHPTREKGLPFHYGISRSEDAAALVRSLADSGYYTIVNETIDVEDGGVSGVSMGGLLEFAPDDTPRAVEKPGAAALPYDLAVTLLQKVYGFSLELPAPDGQRIEFSIHPTRVGHRQTHTVLWEREDVGTARLEAAPRWPNRFSRHIGDKTFGLLIASILDLPVPYTTVISRRVSPFAFGEMTGTAEYWTRTAPVEQEPGLFTTTASWTDPFELLAREDPSATRIAAVLFQEAVDAQWSGATIPSQGDVPDHVEGVQGRGDAFMLGERPPVELPDKVVADVRDLTDRMRKSIGQVRLEWAHDGRQAWVLQAHVATSYFLGTAVLSPGEADTWLDFEVNEGLDALRRRIRQASELRAGIRVHGAVGLTSHVGDLLRKSRVPAVLLEGASGNIT